MCNSRVLISILVSVLVVDFSYAQQESNSTPVDPPALSDEEKQQQSDSADENVDATLKQEPTAEPQVTGETPGNAKAPRKVFRPTEEISEDSPVPFPVDI